MADIVDQAQHVEALERQAAISAALRRPAETPRMDGGVIVCLECGEPIPLARLLAVPHAVRCVACQHEEDAA